MFAGLQVGSIIGSMQRGQYPGKVSLSCCYSDSRSVCCVRAALSDQQTCLYQNKRMTIVCPMDNSYTCRPIQADIMLLQCASTMTLS